MTSWASTSMTSFGGTSPMWCSTRRITLKTIQASAAAWEGSWVTDGASNIEELTVQLLGVMLRRTKDQVLCLPPKARTFFEVEVPKGTATRETLAALELLLDPA